MKKIPFNKIESKEQLAERVVGEDLFVGNKIKYILKFLDKKQLSNVYMKVNVISNSLQSPDGIISQTMYINFEEKTNEQKLDEAIKKFGLEERVKEYSDYFLNMLTKSERYSLR